MSQQQAHKLYIAAFDNYYYDPTELNFVNYCKARTNLENIVKPAKSNP